VARAAIEKGTSAETGFNLSSFEFGLGARTAAAVGVFRPSLIDGGKRIAFLALIPLWETDRDYLVANRQLFIDNGQGLSKALCLEKRQIVIWKDAEDRGWRRLAKTRPLRPGAKGDARPLGGLADHVSTCDDDAIGDEKPSGWLGALHEDAAVTKMRDQLVEGLDGHASAL
jgi:hypothetical protein